MAAMTTVLTEFSDKENSRVYTLSGHTAGKPQQVIQRRKTPTGNQVVLQDDVIVKYATNDANGVLMPQRVAFTVTVTRPMGHESAVMTSALATFRDIVAGDEFGDVVNKQLYLT